MIRFLVRTLVLLLANAVGLFVANLVLDGMSVNASAFILDVVIFTVVVGLMTPFMANQFRRRQSAALGGVALIATLIALIVTDLDLGRVDDRRHRDMARGHGDRLGRVADRGVDPPAPRVEEVHGGAELGSPHLDWPRAGLLDVWLRVGTTVQVLSECGTEQIAARPPASSERRSPCCSAT